MLPLYTLAVYSCFSKAFGASLSYYLFDENLFDVSFPQDTVFFVVVHRFEHVVLFLIRAGFELVVILLFQFSKGRAHRYEQSPWPSSIPFLSVVVSRHV